LLGTLGATGSSTARSIRKGPTGEQVTTVARKGVGRLVLGRLVLGRLELDSFAFASLVLLPDKCASHPHPMDERTCYALE